MTHSRDQAASFFSHLSLIDWFVDNMAMVVGIEDVHGLSNIDVPSPRLIWLQPLLRA